MTQTKGTTTNMTKLVAWDIDEYLGYSDDECLVCLTNKELYVLRNVLRQVKWPTRWTSEIGTPQPDRDNIAEDLAFKLSGTTCTDICDEVQICVTPEFIASLIESSQDLQRVINSSVKSEYYDINQPAIPSILSTDLLSGQSADCGNDKIFGAVTQFVDLLNTISSDVLELFETAFATPSRFGDLVEAIPGVGLLPFDDALQATEKLSQQVKSAYDAAYDSQLRDDFRCELFCIVIDNDCILTMETARDYFKNKITVDVSTAQSFLTLVNNIIANNWLGLQSVYLMHWFILDAIIFGTEILGIDVDRLAQQISIFFNDPNSDWNLLCDPCQNTWSETFDFTISQGDWFLETSASFTPQTRGIFVNGIGWQETFNDSNGFDRRIEGIAIRLDFASALVTNISVDYSFNAGNFVQPQPSQVIWTTNQQEIGNPPSNTLNTTFNASVNDTIDFAIVRLNCARTLENQTPNGSCTITQITITGTGTNPFNP